MQKTQFTEVEWTYCLGCRSTIKFEFNGVMVRDLPLFESLHNCNRTAVIFTVSLKHLKQLPLHNQIYKVIQKLVQLN